MKEQLQQQYGYLFEEALMADIERKALHKK